MIQVLHNSPALQWLLVIILAVICYAAARYDFSLLLIVLILFGVAAVFLAMLMRKMQVRVNSASDAQVTSASGGIFFASMNMLGGLFPVLLLVLLIRSFLYEPFRIPSPSMMPGLHIGDFIVVNKYDYGLRLPVLHTKFFSIGKPDYGDVIVFRYPHNPRVPYIKRVVGLPGDRVAYSGKQILINGQVVAQTPKGIYQTTGAGAGVNGGQLLEENLLERNYDIIHSSSLGMGMGMLPVRDYIVPPQHYFVLGDNRDNSRDSRFWGMVPEENLIGKAVMIWMHWDFQKPFFVDFSRIGNMISPQMPLGTD